jgi:uncharacterized protein
MLRINAEQRTAQPWQNGGGRTRELLARPAGPDWTLRVSLADIEADGPFSSFPGVQRWFAVVQGGGVLLRFAAVELQVRAGDAPICFDGADAPGCALIDGPTRDLNLMLRDGVGAMRLVRAGEPWNERFAERGLFTACAGHLAIDPGDGDSRPATGLRVEALTLLWNLGGLPCSFVPDSPGPCSWWLGHSGNA